MQVALGDAELEDEELVEVVVVLEDSCISTRYICHPVYTRILRCCSIRNRAARRARYRCSRSGRPQSQQNSSYRDQDLLGEAYVVVVSKSELLEDVSDDDSADELLLLSEEVIAAESVVVLGNAICK